MIEVVRLVIIMEALYKQAPMVRNELPLGLNKLLINLDAQNNKILNHFKNLCGNPDYIDNMGVLSMEAIRMITTSRDPKKLLAAMTYEHEEINKKTNEVRAVDTD